MSLRTATLLLLPVLLARAQVTPVIDAVHKGHAVGHEQDGLDAIQAALSAGGNVNERDKSGWTPLMHAALECRADEVRLLLDKGGDPTLRGNDVENSDFVESLTRCCLRRDVSFRVAAPSWRLSVTWTNGTLPMNLQRPERWSGN